MFNVKLSAAGLSYYLPRFSIEGLEALAAYLEDCAPSESFYIGDLDICFAEVPAEWAYEYDEECILARLGNGNILVAQ